MKPTTFRENILIRSALKLLTEANTVSLDSSAEQQALALCPVDFAGKKDKKDMSCAKDKTDKSYKGPVKDFTSDPGKKALKGLQANLARWSKGANIGKYSDSKWETEIRHKKMNNADIGTFTEYFAGEYLYQRFKLAGFSGVELHAQGNANNPGPGSAMVVVKDQFYRRIADDGRIGYTEALMEEYREAGFGQGELAWQAMEEMLGSDEAKAYGTAGKVVKIMLVGSSVASVGSPGLLGQEDMQVLFPDDGNPVTGNAGSTTDNLITFSNKSGGSNPRQINKTPASVGLCSPKQIKDALKALKRTKGAQPGIVESSVDMFLSLNSSITAKWNGNKKGTSLQCYQYLYKSAYGNKGGQTRPSDSDIQSLTGMSAADAKKLSNTDDGYDYIDWSKLSEVQIKNLMYEMVDGIFDKATGAFAPPSGDKAGCMKKNGTKTFTSFSTCVTTILGRMGGAIATNALQQNNITSSDEFYDMLILGTNPSKRDKATSILGTMYPSIFETVLDMHTEKDAQGNDIAEHKGKKYTRSQIAQTIVDRLNGINGRYFSVNETHESAEPMEDVHAGFRGMVECVAQGKGGDFKIVSSNEAGKGDSNASYFVYDCDGTFHAFMTMTLRKNSGSNYSLGGATLNNINDLIAAFQSADSGTTVEDTADELGDIQGSLEQTDEKVDIPADAEGKSVTDKTVQTGEPHGKPHGEDLQTSVEALAEKTPEAASTEAAAEELKKLTSALVATINKATQSSKDPKKLTTRKIQDELLAAIPDHDTNPKVEKLVKKFGFNSLASFNSQKVGVQKKFIKQLLKIVSNDKLKALHDKLIKENKRRRSMSGTYTDLIQETIAFVLREADDPELIDLFVEDLFDAEPEKAGEVMSDIADEVSNALGDSEMPAEEQKDEMPEENPEDMQESRWLKLAGLLKG